MYLEGVFSDAPMPHPSMLANSYGFGEEVVCRLKRSRDWCGLKERAAGEQL